MKFNLLKAFKPLRVPQSLAGVFQKEYLEFKNRYVDFLIKYVGWSLVLSFSVADFIFNPKNKETILLTRLTIIPPTLFLYFFRDLKIFKKYRNLRLRFIWIYGTILLHILVVLTSDPRVIYPYSCGNFMTSVILLIFLQVDILETVIILASIYVPYLIYLAWVDMQSGPYLFVLIGSVGISITLICNSILRKNTFISDFLARHQLIVDAQIGENISQISHDTRAPLTALKALHEGFFTGEEAKDVLKKSVGRLIELVEDITQAASSLQINIQPIDLKTFFEECRQDVEFLHPKSAFTWEVNLRVAKFFFDRNKIKRVLINLVNNAVKASTETQAPIKIKCESSELNLRVVVIDQGIGFQPETDLFKKGISKFGGSGLGLHFCKKVIGDHKGQITANHESGTTTFQFVI